MSPEARWLLAFGGLTVVLLIAAETSIAPAAAGLAVLVAGSATFLLLPTSLKNLGFVQ